MNTIRTIAELDSRGGVHAEKGQIIERASPGGRQALPWCSSRSMNAKGKYSRTARNIKAGQIFFPMLVGKHVSSEKAIELARKIKDAMFEIPPGSKDETKYELAYENWIRLGRVGYSFIRKNMGTRGMEIFIDEKVRMLIAENAGLSFHLYAALKMISLSKSFEITVKRMTREMQWITPSYIKEISDSMAIIEVPHCKVKEYEGTEDFCAVGCQQVYPRWILEQFQLSMKFLVHGSGCTCYVSQMPMQFTEDSIRLSHRCG